MTHERTLLVIGAGPRQCALIQRAVQMGIRVVAVDRDAKAPGLALAQAHGVVDARDVEAIVRFAGTQAIDGCLSEQSDVAVYTVAAVAERLGLPGIGEVTARRATNKAMMRTRCLEAGLPTPRFAVVASVEDATQAARAIGYPVVIKPIDDQSSRGVLKVWNERDLADQFPKTVRFGSTGTALVEEMMTGRESSVECIVVGGRTVTLAICDKTKCAPPFSFDLELVYPARFQPEVVQALRELNEQVISAIGIEHGLTHGEYIVTPAGPRLIEIAARGCGARVATDLVPAMTGVDPISLRIRQALGEPIAAPVPTRSRAGVLGFFTAAPGKVGRVSGVDEARALPGVIDVEVSVNVGDRVGTISSADLRLGSFLIASDNTDEALRVAERVRGIVRIEIEKEA